MEQSDKLFATTVQPDSLNKAVSSCLSVKSATHLFAACVYTGTHIGCCLSLFASMERQQSSMQPSVNLSASIQLHKTPQSLMSSARHITTALCTHEGSYQMTWASLRHHPLQPQIHELDRGLDENSLRLPVNTIIEPHPLKGSLV